MQYVSTGMQYDNTCLLIPNTCLLVHTTCLLIYNTSTCLLIYTPSTCPLVYNKWVVYNTCLLVHNTYLFVYKMCMLIFNTTGIHYVQAFKSRCWHWDRLMTVPKSSDEDWSQDDDRWRSLEATWSAELWLDSLQREKEKSSTSMTHEITFVSTPRNSPNCSMSELPAGQLDAGGWLQREASKDGQP